MNVPRMGGLLALAFAGMTAGAQQRLDSVRTGAAVFSIGQPPLYSLGASVLADIGGRESGASARLSLGVRRAILSPVTGILGARAELFGSVGRPAAGGNALLESRAMGLGGGVQWNANAGRLRPLFTYETAVRRGGIIGGGSMVRVDWRVGDGIGVGLSRPFGNRLAGRTRALRTTVDLKAVADSIGQPARATSAPAIQVSPRLLTTLRAVVETLSAYSNAYSPRASAIVAADRDGYSAAVTRYDSVVIQLFQPASRSAAANRRVARLARNTIFDQLVLPFDGLFGQPKSNPHDLTPLRRSASRRFAASLSDSAFAGVDAAAAQSYFDAWTAAIGSNLSAAIHDVQDSRFLWLPVELALAPEQFDEQFEVDSLIARAVGHPFSDQNALTYLRSSDLPLEIARSIYAARDYHVLWTHDFTGRRVSGAIDNVAYSMVADAYLPALTATVRRYDSTGVLPAYIILQDQFFYEPRDNRLWMTILEDPLHASMTLRGDSGRREAHLLERQRELRAAVASSARLQRDARAGGNPERWIRDRVKVHVNIVEPSDFSFRSSHIIDGVPFTPDNIMREHRKLVFYDLNERDPYRGAMLIMGVGIGEHYASATWEDRGYRVRGPATLDARRAVREALLRNGFDSAQIPSPLRELAPEKAVEAAANAHDYVGRALQVHNEVGFARKESSVARALLYNLAPPGSVIIVPDPMWLSDTWAGMLAAAAARGCRVFIIAPAAANAPSPQAPLLAVQRTILGRLLALRDTLAPAMRASYGELRVGMFAAHAQIDDAAALTREIREGLARAPWIRGVIPFDDATIRVLEQTGVTAASGHDATALASDEKPREPQLHQKSQLIARPGAIAALLRQPGWDQALARSLRMQTQETARFADQLGWTEPAVDTLATRSNDAILRGYEQSIPEAERKRVSFYFSVGTQNEDDRGIALDGEATLIVSGIQASAGVVDLFTLMARSDWIDSADRLNAYIPSRAGWMSRLAWWIRAAF